MKKADKPEGDAATQLPGGDDTNITSGGSDDAARTSVQQGR
jgi:hypothetical protein